MLAVSRCYSHSAEISWKMLQISSHGANVIFSITVCCVLGLNNENVMFGLTVCQNVVTKTWQKAIKQALAMFGLDMFDIQLRSYFLFVFTRRQSGEGLWNVWKLLNEKLFVLCPYWSGFESAGKKNREFQNRVEQSLWKQLSQKYVRSIRAYSSCYE